MKLWISVLSAMALFVVSIAATDDARADKPEKYTVGVSIYAGWMPWYYAKESGIMKKWADKAGIEVEIQHMDYIPSVEAFVAEKVDACVMTNMECLDMPAASGIDCTVLILGDYSNGNDAVLVRDGLDVKSIKGHEVSLVELSVSHYLLVRMLEQAGMKERDVKIINTSDSDIGPAFMANKKQKAVVTWNPIVMQVEQVPGVTKIYDSSKTPGEILDLMVVNTDVLEKSPKLGEALVGAWFEVMTIMSSHDKAAEEAMSSMADHAGCSLVEYKNQLRTTAMFWTPESAVEFMKGKEIQEKMGFVRNFCFDHGLLGEGAPSVDILGISYPDGTIQGDAKNVKMRFDSSYMETVAQ